MLPRFSLYLLCACLTYAHQSDSQDGCVQTTFRGRKNQETGINQHTLVYATVPQRWGQAVPTEYAAHQTHDASAPSQRCSQMICVACGWRPPKIDPWNEESTVEGVEQCLYLSAYTPPKRMSVDPLSLMEDEPNKNDESSLPVVFHIHHGQFLYGFKTEHGEVKNVVQKGIVVSNANFRLGALGFLAHPDMQQVNVGQQDLALALGWIQRHICSVQGNPRQVTVTGSSTGASQALLLLASKSTEGLFDAAWVNSPTTFGMPDFFSSSVATVFEKEVRHQMSMVGCGTLQCMQEMPVKRLLLSLSDPLENSKVMQAIPSRSFFAFDGEVVPNMNKVACDNAISRRPEHVVVGQSKDEMDNLKFQFNLPKIVTNLVAVQAEKMSIPDTNTVRCLQKEMLKAQGPQETAEDAMFNLGSYLSSSSSGGKPRWHFLMTAPASKSRRTWHTLAELLTWSPDPLESTAQYDKMTKEFVYGNASPELMAYIHKNFIHFARTKTVKDTNWTQTTPVQQGVIGGLPSKIMNQSPLSSQPHNEHHHSSYTIHSLHELSCSKADSPRLSAAIQGCKNYVPMEGPEDSELHWQMSTLKKSDLVFAQELKKAWSTAIRKEILATKLGISE